jgi:hypothetical protein
MGHLRILKNVMVFIHEVNNKRSNDDLTDKLKEENFIWIINKN